MAIDPFDYTVKPGFPEGHRMHNHGLDPQKVDDIGRPVVHGKPWSECGTGIFLNVLVTKGDPVRLDRRWTGRTLKLPFGGLPFGGETWLHISASKGKPTADVPTWGACLEVPSDLGDDDLKQTYVTDWFIATVAEAVVLSGHDPRKLASARAEMVGAVEDALRGQNL